MTRSTFSPTQKVDIISTDVHLYSILLKGWCRNIYGIFSQKTDLRENKKIIKYRIFKIRHHTIPITQSLGLRFFKFFTAHRILQGLYYIKEVWWLEASGNQVMCREGLRKQKNARYYSLFTSVQCTYSLGSLSTKIPVSKWGFPAQDKE